MPSCAKCTSEIAKQADACPKCGYDGEKGHRMWFRIHGITAILSAITVVGAPLTLWSIWRGRKHKKAIKRAPQQ